MPVTCILTGAPGENPDDCTTHRHAEAWRPWQLANDRATYGDDAAKYIIVSDDGERELLDGLVYDTEAEARAACALVNADTCRACGQRGLAPERGQCGTCDPEDNS